MSNLIRLAELGDEFDSLGRHDLANKVDTILKLAADVRVNFESPVEDRPFSKEEYQRLLSVVFEHLIDIYFEVIPKIDYLKPFWDTIRSALETARARVKINIAKKTKAFDYKLYRKWAEELAGIRKKLIEWGLKDLTSARVLQERFYLLVPLKRILRQLEHTFSDDQALQSIADEWGRLLIILDNVFDQTTSEIIGMDFKRSV